MQSQSPREPTKRFRLSEEIIALVNHSADPIIRDVEKILIEFEYSEILGTTYVWKYLPDEAFSHFYAGPDVYKMNHAFLSHLFRVIEAFEIVSVWRAWELVDSCVTSLNKYQFVSAATLARSLLELTVQYGIAVNTLRASFDQFPWQNLRTHALGLDCMDERGKKAGLESYIERLMSGTRLGELLNVNQEMEQRNILSIIDKTDKALTRQQTGYLIRPHYDILCELAHPNTVGYQRFLTSITSMKNGWTARVMEANTISESAIHIALECLWALSFSAGSMNGLFAEFQKLKRVLGKHLGRILPT
jgi:hypothetical protein